MAVAAHPFAGTFEADRTHSSFGFAVKRMGVSTFRGSFGDVAARLVGDDGAISLEGMARVGSISIIEPAEFRAHVLGEQFFDAEQHPEISFRSEAVELLDGRALVRGELTIAGITRSITANGTYAEPTEDPYGNVRGAIELHTVISRGDFGMTWNEPLPNGGTALADAVELSVHLELVREG